MTRSAEREALSSRVAKRLFPLAVMVGFLISLVIPSVYCALEWNGASREGHMQAESLARSVRSLASESPALWKYQALKYEQLFHLYASTDIITISIVGEDGSIIANHEMKASGSGLFKNLRIAGAPDRKSVV